jgi:beta-glucosidase
MTSTLFLAFAALAAHPVTAREAKAAQPPIETRSAPVLTVDGLRFRDLDRNGRLDTYEDWRLPESVRARDLTARMTVPEKAGMMMHAVNSGYFGPGGAVLDQLAPPPPGALKPPVNVTGVPGFDRADKPSPRDLILNRHVRYIMTSPGGSPADAARWANALQEMAEGTRLGVPIVFSADPIHTTNRLPGGALPPPDRVKITSSWPDQIGLGAARDPELVHRFGEIASAELRAMGFRMILNPMADVVSEPRWNRIPGTFGEDARLNGEYAAQFILGAQGTKLGRDGIMAVVKHFPGDGPVEHGLDPHNPYGTKLVYPGRRWKLHYEAFAPSFKAHVAFAMGSYGIPTWIDDVASNFSRKVMTGLLRTKMRFKGVAITAQDRARTQNGLGRHRPARRRARDVLSHRPRRAGEADAKAYRCVGAPLARTDVRDGSLREPLRRSRCRAARGQGARIPGGGRACAAQVHRAAQERGERAAVGARPHGRARRLRGDAPFAGGPRGRCGGGGRHRHQGQRAVPQQHQRSGLLR